LFAPGRHENFDSLIVIAIGALVERALHRSGQEAFSWAGAWSRCRRDDACHQACARSVKHYESGKDCLSDGVAKGSRSAKFNVVRIATRNATCTIPGAGRPDQHDRTSTPVIPTSGLVRHSKIGGSISDMGQTLLSHPALVQVNVCCSPIATVSRTRRE
jgi:hypothetical protein